MFGRGLSRQAVVEEAAAAAAAAGETGHWAAERSETPAEEPPGAQTATMDT